MRSFDDHNPDVFTTMLQVDRSIDVPIHHQIASSLRQRISDGSLRPGDRIPSIRDLATKLDVNHLTVRQALRSLSGDGLIQSNPGRGTFVSDRKKTALHVALMVPNLGMTLSSSISRGVQEVARREGGRVSIYDLHDSPELLVEHLESLQKHSLDGAIVFPLVATSATRAVLKLILDHYPLVLVDRHLSEVPSWNVMSDNLGGGKLVTEHLARAGAKRIAFVSDLSCTPTLDRFEGYREAIGEAGMAFDRQLVREVVGDAESGTRKHVQELMSLDDKPDGIFFGNDFMALWGMKELRSLGYRIPDDVQIAGFDDEPASALVDPPLTTIRQDGEKIGAAAAELFFKQVYGHADEEPTSTIIPVELVVRSTTRRSEMESRS